MGQSVLCVPPWRVQMDTPGGPEVYQKNKKHKLTRRAGPNQTGFKCHGACGERLTRKSFGAHSSESDGRRRICRDCGALYQQSLNYNKDLDFRRYRLLHGIRHIKRRSCGWEGRLRQLREIGRVTPRGRGGALKRMENMRLVCGKLIVCKPRKRKKSGRA